MLTERGLAAQFAGLGLESAVGVLVHSSLSRLGRLENGAATLHAALQRVVGPTATIVVPTQTANNSLTSRAHLAAVRAMTESQRLEYIARMPGYDPRTSPSFEVGSFAEYVRTRPHAVRSPHPQTSFAAIGPSAAEWLAIHDLDCHLGNRSPLGALEAANAQVLLAGVGFEHCTAFHLAEYRVRNRLPDRTYQCFLRNGYDRDEITFQALDLYDGDFATLGASMKHESFVRTAEVGETWAILFPMREAVAFAIRWMEAHPDRGKDAAGAGAGPREPSSPTPALGPTTQSATGPKPR